MIGKTSFGDFIRDEKDHFMIALFGLLAFSLHYVKMRTIWIKN